MSSPFSLPMLRQGPITAVPFPTMIPLTHVTPLNSLSVHHTPKTHTVTGTNHDHSFTTMIPLSRISTLNAITHNHFHPPQKTHGA